MSTNLEPQPRFPALLKRSGLVISAAALAALTALWWLPPAEPTHQGRTVREWLRTLDRSPIETIDFFPAPNQPAVAAFRGLGTNAIPVLRAELTVQDSGFKLWWAGLLKKQTLLKVEFVTVTTRHRSAISACVALGPEARELLPEITAAFAAAYDPLSESVCLVGMGPAGFRALTNGFSSTNALVRIRSASAFRYVHYDAQAAIPGLLRCLEDKTDARIRSEAAMALGSIGQQADVVVPALVKRLGEDSDPSVRGFAAHALGMFGARAKAAVPALVKSLDDKAGANAWAFASLQQIDPVFKPASQTK